MKSGKNQITMELATELLENVPVGIAVSDRNGNIVWCNETLARFLNDSRGNLLQNSLPELKGSKLRPITEASDTVLVPGGENMPDRWLKHQSIALNAGGDAAYTATVYSDISEVSSLLAEQEKLTEQLNQLSTVDRESGLLNHRAMLQHLEPLVSRSRRYNNNLSVITMELTNLDSIVDDFGPDAASHSVVEVSRLLKDQMRWADIVSRVEYNRFVFILPETDKPSAVHLANKICAQVAELQVQHENTSFHLEANFGVTSWEKGNDSVLLLRKAHQALDAARDNGSNAVESV
ncbi:MAG: diguanylate cyclase [Gammaproteobacteria bacterium]|nr:diguanylate cyclase [Gammaproteobacteria bacterium]